MDSTFFWYNVCEYDFFTERERHLREREHVVAALSRDTRRATCTYRHTVCVFSQLSKKPKKCVYDSRQY